MLARRELIGAGVAIAGTGVALRTTASAETIEINMLGDPSGEHVGFDPIGLLIQPGQVVRWTCRGNYHTTTAYHPRNGNRSLRIPRAATPWSSDVLAPGMSFEVRLTVEGVYDYCCQPHELAGMVGRIIVGHPAGPGTLPFDWFKGTAEGKTWVVVPAAAQAAFPSIDAIMRQRIVHGQLAAMQM